MNIPGLLIEYLIGGALALVWLYPLFGWWAPCETKALVNFLSNNKALAPLLAIPCIYVLGLLIDQLASGILKLFGLKDRVRAKVEAKHRRDDLELPTDQELSLAEFRIAFENAALADRLEQSSSRDRIARCAFVNAIIAAFVLPLHGRWELSVVAVAFAGALAVSWWFCESWSHRYKLRALEAIKNAPPASGK